MASNPPSSCCTIGIKHDGEASGNSFKVGSFDAYEAKPTGKNVHEKTAILYLPDVIGIWQNSQLMADQFAANGYYTLIPDLFNEDPMSLGPPPEGFDFMKWMTKGTSGDNPHTPEAIDPVIAKSIEFLHSKGYTKIGAVGYCFGAKYVARFLAKGKGINAGFVAHPSFVSEEELAAITGPFSIAAAETDEIFPADKRHQSEVILKDTKLPYQITLYSGTTHGFSVRGDIKDPVQKYAKEQAFIQAVTWFDHHLL